jgi:AcrR family transcriptional regulator
MSVDAAIMARSPLLHPDNRKARGYGHERPAEILAAARELFLERGVEQVTTRQIAARMGISQTALYVYFDNKDQMLETLAERAWTALGEALDMAGACEKAARCPSQRLRALVVAFMAFWLEHPDDYRIAFLRRALKPCVEAAQAQAPSKTLLARLTRGVEEAVAVGALRCLGSPQATALSVWAAMSGMIGLRLRYPDFPWPPVSEHIETMAELILHGCAATA